MARGVTFAVFACAFGWLMLFDPWAPFSREVGVCEAGAVRDVLAGNFILPSYDPQARLRPLDQAGILLRQPFDAASVGGSANAKSYEFTGRENDGTGLYFSRRATTAQPSAILLRFGSLGLTLEGAQERHQIVLLFRGQFVAEDQVKELDCVIQRQQSLVMQVGWVVLDAPERERLDLPVPDLHYVVDHFRFEEALRFQIVQ
jgi:hypothetical protein